MTADYDYDVLAPEMQTSIDAWLGSGKPGLWVVGKRRIGSSYIAGVALRRTHRAFPEAKVQDALYVRAATLLRDIRRQWDAESLLRANPGDFALWQEVSQLQQGLDGLWDSPAALWLDDLHEDTDLAFFHKHVMLWLDIRVKTRKPTIVAGAVPPRGLGTTMDTVINDLFFVISAER